MHDHKDTDIDQVATADGDAYEAPRVTDHGSLTELTLSSGSGLSDGIGASPGGFSS